MAIRTATPSGIPHTSKRRHLSYVVAAVLMGVLIINAVVSIHSDHEEVLQSNRGLLVDLVNLVSAQTERSLELTDNRLVKIRDLAAKTQASSGGFNDPAFRAAFTDLTDDIPGKVGVLILNPQGDVVASSESPVPPKLNLASRPDFQALHEKDTLFIGPALRSQLEPERTLFYLSRRIPGPDGELAGIVSAGISTSYLTDLYALAGSSKNALILVTNGDGNILGRRPLVKEYLGQSIASSTLFTDTIKTADTGTAEIISPLDELPRLAAWKILRPANVMVMAGFEWPIIYKYWNKRTARTLIATLISLIVIVGGTVATRLLKRREERIRRDLAAAMGAQAETTRALLDARHDHLTGLPARALFFERACDLLEQARRDGFGLAVMVIDLDGFKAVNDREGHEQGDAVLVKAATILSGTIRGSDTAGRLGGDEFGVVIAAPLDFLESITHKLGSRIVNRMASIGHGITCSVGVALCSDPQGESLDDLLHRADKAMYDAKHAGKNRLHLSAPSVVPVGFQ
ncbi:MAG: diguanylate cyclase [Rhodocyclaceae bacterium]